MTRGRLVAAARWATLAIVAFVSLANAVPQAWGGSEAVVSSYFDVPKLLAFGVALLFATGLWIAGSLFGGTGLRSAGLPQWALLALLVLGLAGAATGVHPLTAFFGDSYQYQGMLVWLGYGLLWFLLVQTIDARRHAVAAAWVVVGIGVGVALYDFVQMLWLDIASWGVQAWMAKRGVSTIGNPNHLGGFLIVPLILAASLALGAERRTSRWIAAGAATACGAAIVLTLTRGSWVAAFVGVCVLGVVALRAYGGRLRLGYAGMTAGLLSATMLVAWLVRRDFIEGVVRRVLVQSGDSGRSIMWGEAVRIISDSPVLGVGPDSYRLAWYGERSAELPAIAGMGIVVTEPHNVVLTIAATFGVLGAAAALTWVGSVLWRTRSAVKNDAGTGALPLAGWWAATVALVTYLMLGPSPIPLSVLLVVCLGVLAAAGGQRLQQQVSGTGSVKMLAFVAAAIIAIAVLTVSVRTFSAEKAMTTALNGGPQGVAYAQRAVELAPWSTAARLRLAGVYANQATQGPPQSAEAKSAIESAIAAYEEAAAFSPKDLDVYWEYAFFMSKAAGRGQVSFESVVEVAERGLAVDSYSLAVAMNEVVALEALSRHDEIVTLLDDLWDLDPALTQPSIAYARALGRTGDSTAAFRVLDTLSERFPSDQSIVAVRSEIESASADAR